MSVNDIRTQATQHGVKTEKRRDRIDGTSHLVQSQEFYIVARQYTVKVLDRAADIDVMALHGLCAGEIDHGAGIPRAMQDVFENVKDPHRISVHPELC
jgi:hypothetical protein